VVCLYVTTPDHCMPMWLTSGFSFHTISEYQHLVNCCLWR